ncbi:hypothetical protein ACOBV9_19915 (plasmid) [Pseudoalteromonas espejiana]
MRSIKRARSYNSQSHEKQLRNEQLVSDGAAAQITHQLLHPFNLIQLFEELLEEQLNKLRRSSNENATQAGATQLNDFRKPSHAS